MIPNRPIDSHMNPCYDEHPPWYFYGKDNTIVKPSVPDDDTASVQDGCDDNRVYTIDDCKEQCTLRNKMVIVVLSIHSVLDWTIFYYTQNSAVFEEMSMKSFMGNGVLLVIAEVIFAM